MKRSILLAVTFVAATSSFAYYGGYSSSSDSAFYTFIGLISLVGGVFDIILFFKIWGMTEDVRAIKKEHFHEEETDFIWRSRHFLYLRKNLVLGNIEIVKRILLQNFIKNITKAYNQAIEGNNTELVDESDKWLSAKERALKVSIRHYVEQLQEQFDKIGEELPIYIQRMQTFGDYYNIFTEEDFSLNKTSAESNGK